MGRGQYELVARVEEQAHDHEEGGRRPARHHDPVRAEGYAAPALAVGRDRLAQGVEPTAVGVVGVAGGDGGGDRPSHLGRRGEPRLADPELQHVEAGAGHLHAALHHLHGEERRDGLHAGRIGHERSPPDGNGYPDGTMPIVPVDDPLDARLHDFHAVPDPVLLRRRGLFVAESRFVVRELLAHPRLAARSLLATPAALASLRDLLDDRTLDTLPVYVAPPPVLKQITGFRVHRGCLAIGERLPPATDAELPALADARLVVVLEQVGNPDNLGSIFRNAAAFGAGCVLLSPGCCDPLYRKAIRTSIGATLRIPYGEIPDWPDGLDRLRLHGYATVALAPDRDADDLQTLAAAPAEPIGPGVRRRGRRPERRRGDLHRQAGSGFPSPRASDSLNVATAAGIALYALSAGPR